MKFEDFGGSPEFTSVISKFISDNCNQIKNADEKGEQPIENYLLFQKYSETIEKVLESFLKKENITNDNFYEACQFAKDENLPCNFLDYILSSIEYEDFYFLMIDYKNMQNKEVNEDKINEIRNKEI